MGTLALSVLSHVVTHFGAAAWLVADAPWRVPTAASRCLALRPIFSAAHFQRGAAASRQRARQRLASFAVVGPIKNNVITTLGNLSQMSKSIH